MKARHFRLFSLSRSTPYKPLVVLRFDEKKEGPTEEEDEVVGSSDSEEDDEEEMKGKEDNKDGDKEE